MGHRRLRHSPGVSARMPISEVALDAPEEVSAARLAGVPGRDPTVTFLFRRAGCGARSTD